MKITDKSRLLTAALCIIFCLFGYFIGNSFPLDELSLLTGEVATPASFSQFLGELYPLCRTLMFQFAVVFIFAFTPYKHIANCSVFFLRGCAVGYAAELMLTQESSDLTTVCFAVSYLLITAVMMISVLRLSGLKEGASKESVISQRLHCAVSALFLFLTSTGASALIRIVPVIAEAAKDLK